MKPRSKGAHALRLSLANVLYHLEVAGASLAIAKTQSNDLGATDELAIAVKALRGIANYSKADARSAGLARAALKRLRAQP